MEQVGTSISGIEEHLDGQDLPSPLTGDSVVVGDGAFAALLERVIQRIFTAGLLLHEGPDGRAVSGASPALAELDTAIRDIRATALCWRAPRWVLRTTCRV